MIDGSKGHEFKLKYDLSDRGLEYFECEKCNIIICKMLNFVSDRKEKFTYYMMGGELSMYDNLGFSYSLEINNILKCDEYIIKSII